MLRVSHLSKRYGPVLAVDDVSFEVRPGRVTGFLGPNGAGKTTTLRMILGLDAPSGGQALVDGRPYRRLRRPLLHMGALLDAGAVHPGRTGRQHLFALARSNGIGTARADAVLEEVGMAAAARRRVGGYSLGMRQRLGIAAALLGDPGIVVFDEPTNGLDPEGIQWTRSLFRRLAAEGRVVFVSSHLMSEMENTADHLVVIGHGRLICDTPVADLVAGRGGTRVVVRAVGGIERFERLLGSGGATTELLADGALQVRGLSAEQVGDLAASHGIRIRELTTHHRSLEEVFMELTGRSAQSRFQVR
ncbi:ATP-binding cassette domain-containing protein [Actinomadura rupiterrae]|uniref:ATP-binding cassette domain-containing protein n=1 Tax=Actinomadura rupiterrae TaxID=559627 RepID=UPI0020A28B8D|nr:ATP-binding cassette domain-containing protein [Actinomadura rupiterrae]MCP2343169.1 ABC-2 type transport system ATP-binding protein [Actinomadura rupiterrae]